VPLPFSVRLLVDTMKNPMGSNIKLKASDGHEFGAYVSEAKAVFHSAVVVIQEIFGVNSHIRSVVDDYAGQGFYAIAPALFDRVQPDLELTYEQPGIGRGRDAAGKIKLDIALLDVAAAIRYAAQVPGVATVAVLGFCWGGTLAWLAATRLNPAAAVGYYGGQIAKYAAEVPTCPVLLHFGEKDQHIGPEEIATIRQAHPDIPMFLYDAGHGFNCDQRKDYDPPSAVLARQRTLDFFRAHL
jgi:carboxymethylenebutenolidase